MSDEITALGSLILLGLSYPAAQTAWWLLFPERVEKARVKIVEEPKRSFWIGVLAALIAAIPGVFLFAVQVPFFRALGLIWLAVVLGFASLGAAGIAAELGLRVNWKNDGAFLSLGAFLRGALIWELAAALPLIGWLIVIPVGTLISLGGFIRTLGREKDPQEEKAEA